MVNIYNIGYYSYEESEYCQFYFDRKLTDDELAEYVTIATVKALQHLLDTDDGTIWWGMPNDGISFQQIFKRVVVELESLGFKPVKFDAQFSIFGWKSIVKPDSEFFQDFPDEKLDRLISRIPDELKRKALERANKDR